MTEQKIIGNDNALIINDLHERIQEFLSGGRRFQTLTQKTLQKLSWANYFSPGRRGGEELGWDLLETSLTPVFFASLPWTWILLVKDTLLEQPFLVHGYKCCTDIVNINVKVMV